MDSSDQNVEMLSSFGLSRKQAKVYLSLVSLGTATVGEISRHSKVRREEVYRILPKLEKMGLIEKTLTTPVRLRAISIESALSILIKNEEENVKKRVTELTTKKTEFLEHYRTSFKKTESSTGDQFSLTSDKMVTLNKIKTLIDNAQTEIEYCTSREKLLQFIRYFSESLNHAADRGVKIRFISNLPNEEDDLPSAINLLLTTKKSIFIRYTENLPNHFIIADNKEVLSATSTVGYLADNPMLWSNNAPHVMVYKKLFQELWNSSVETLSMNVMSGVDKLKHFVKQMKPAEHVMLLYETTRAKMKVLLNYLKVGLDNGEATVYVCSESSVEEITEAIGQFGVDVIRCQNSGALKVIDYTQHYIIDGMFNIETTTKLWEHYYDEAISKGFKGLRVTVEMACFFKHNLLKELVIYERLLHKKPAIPMIAIYAYRADQLMEKNNSVNVYSELVKTHGGVLFTWVDKELGRIAII